jgi:hypothetical protein
MAERYEGDGTTANVLASTTFMKGKTVHCTRCVTWPHIGYAHTRGMVAQHSRDPHPAGAARSCTGGGGPPTLLWRAHIGAASGSPLGPGQRRHVRVILPAAPPDGAHALRRQRTTTTKKEHPDKHDLMGAPGRNLDVVLKHIVHGNEWRLTYTPPLWLWALWVMVFASSSSSLMSFSMAR